MKSAYVTRLDVIDVCNEIRSRIVKAKNQPAVLMVELRPAMTFLLSRVVAGTVPDLAEIGRALLADKSGALKPEEPREVLKAFDAAVLNPESWSDFMQELSVFETEWARRYERGAQ